jgi:hypothetical protein
MKNVSENEEFNRLKRIVEALELGEIVEVQNRKEALLVKLKINLSTGLNSRRKEVNSCQSQRNP